MKKIRQNFVRIVSVGVAAALLCGVLQLQSATTSLYPHSKTGESAEDNVRTEKISPAHGVVINNGEFEFEYMGQTYSNEYERLLAQDGFIYGTVSQGER